MLTTLRVYADLYSLSCRTEVRAYKHREQVDACILATGTHRPGSGCCTFCTRSRRPLYVQTPLRPRPPSPAALVSGRRTRRTVPVDKHATDEPPCIILILNISTHTVTCDQCDLLTTMSSSVTRGCRLFTVIFVPSKGLNTGWRETNHTIKHLQTQW